MFLLVENFVEFINDEIANATKKMLNCVSNIDLTVPVPMKLWCSSTHFVAPTKKSRWLEKKTSVCRNFESQHVKIDSFSVRNHNLVGHFKKKRSKHDSENTFPWEHFGLVNPPHGCKSAISGTSAEVKGPSTPESTFKQQRHVPKV